MNITINLNEDDAWTLAQLFKRITYEGIEKCAVDKAETNYMISIIGDIRTQLSNQGINPR